MSTVIIAEKPSMARAIREGLGSAASRFEITNAFGHILEQAEPDAYLPDSVPKTAKGKKVWRIEDLPILPQEWIKFPKREAKDQLKKIGALLKQADTVINAGDPDREGQLLIDEILEHFRYRGRVQRVWLKALDRENVQRAFAALELNDKYRPLKDAAWNNAKITAHNAIVPTGERVSGLSEVEAKIYDLIWKSYVALFLPEYRYKALSALVEINGETWKATGRQDLDLGWKKLYGGHAGDDEEEADGSADESRAPIPVMQTGDAVAGEGGRVQSRQTKPSAHFTDGSLIDAMSNIHKFVTDPEARAKLKETSGLGTEATRASILETLLARQYLQKKGKQLLSTPKGRVLIAYLEKQGLAEFADPVTTARWEDLLSGVAEGRIPAGRFVGAVADSVKEAVATMKTGSAALAAQSQSNGKGNSKSGKAVTCPICKGSATVRRLESKKKKGVFFWSCSNRDAHPLLADDHGKPGKPFGARA